MVTDAKSLESISNWVGLNVAAKITGLDPSSITRNGSLGRLVFRVREGHVYYYKPQLVEWERPPMGSPDLIDDDSIRISAEAKKVIQETRRRLKALGADAICMVVESEKHNSLRVIEMSDGVLVRQTDKKLP